MKESKNRNIPITIPFELLRSSSKSVKQPLKNEMINANDRYHYHIKGVLTQHLRQIGEIEAYKRLGKLDTALFTKNNPCFVVVHICPPSNRRTDAPNWYPTVKALIDGMTDANVFEDDNDSIVTGLIFLPGQKTTTKKYHVILDIYYGDIKDIFVQHMAYHTDKAHKIEVPYIVKDDEEEHNWTAMLDTHTGEITNVPLLNDGREHYIIVNNTKLAVKKHMGQYDLSINMEDWLPPKEVEVI